ncbi:S-layer homology domain-containing protein [Bacillus alkalicellulosilyticus]|uniref:S-layer homology domain-containing protein n=1 Tax=Alkalihalobacterium alkalicellulosilyticum TaxID=1912214 RepID=UPI000997E635|nr:S-layer homology domain-containing protein [Bacillus alkalicellulosilyticus]
MKSYFTKSLFLTGFILLFSFNSVSASTDIEGFNAKDSILKVVEEGIITGDANGYFNLSRNITIQDSAIILAKSLELENSSSSVTATFLDSSAFLEAAVKAGLISGTGVCNFEINANLTR